MKMLTEYDHEIVQKNIGGGHRYQVAGVSCKSCARCKKGQTCIGLPSVTAISGRYKDGDLYGAGLRAAADLMFGPWKDRVAKNEVEEGGWIVNAPTRPTEGELRVAGMHNPEAYFRSQFEAIPNPGDIARDFGVGMHSTLEEWLRAKAAGEEPFLDYEVHAPYIESAKKVVEWLDKHEVEEILDVEVNIYHPSLLYGGQVDCVARRGNSVLLLDWKSGKGIYKDAAVQIAAYAMAYEVLTGETVNEGWVVRSGRTGEFEAKRVVDLDLAKQTFLHLQAVREGWDEIQWEVDES